MNVKRLLRSVVLRIPVPVLCNPATRAGIAVLPKAAGTRMRTVTARAIVLKARDAIERQDADGLGRCSRGLRLLLGSESSHVWMALREKLVTLGRHAEAAEACRGELNAAPAELGPCFELASILECRDRTERSLNDYREVIRDLRNRNSRFGEETGDVQLLAGIGIRLAKLGEEFAAESCIRRAIESDPASGFAIADKLRREGLWHEAERCFRAVEDHHPRTKAERLAQARCFLSFGPLSEAIACYRRILDEFPNELDARCCVADAQRSLGDVDAAFETCRAALEAGGDSPRLHDATAACLAEQGRFSEALASCDRAIALAPDWDSLKFNRTYSLLALGRFEEGWDAYGHRTERKRYRELLPAAVRWSDGESLAGRRVTILATFGIGDEVRFASCYHDAIRLASHVNIVCEPRLVTIFERSFREATVWGYRRRFSHDVPVSIDERTIDYQIVSQEILDGIAQSDVCCLASDLPGLVRRSYDSFRREAPYLTPSSSRRHEWRKRLAALGPGPKVGVGWRSGLLSAQRSREYTVLGDWAPVLALDGVHFVNLQYDAEEELLAPENAIGAKLHTWPDLDLKDGVEDLAALMCELDLVVSAPTFTLEIAGAVGAPALRVVVSKHVSNVWRMWPGGTRDLWHPTMRMIASDPIGDVPKTIELVAREIASLRPEERQGVERREGAPCAP
ncbi:MAG: tetratricopeptide repeat-containing glycosyltransferase family protein [Planctomycetaceae bacterium]